MSDDATEDDLTGVCEQCGDEANTVLFEGWRGKAELCGPCYTEAVIEE